MNKPVSVSNMKMINKLSHNDFNRWATSVYKSGYNDGLTTGHWVSDESIFNILRHNGIGAGRANKICGEILALVSECPYTLEA